MALAERFLAHLGDTTPARGTNLGAPADASDDDLVAVARLALDAGVLGIVVDASAVHDRGASDAQELGWSVVAAARALRVLEAGGIDVGRAAGLVEFRYAATDDQFPTIAKLRAARLLWSRLLQICGAEPADQRQHAVTSRPMMSAYDPWVNMLRTTVAAFAATVGGADAVTVQPFDRPLGRPDAFGRRIARNQMALLNDEAHVGAVTDPAGGAWAVERLTHDLAAAAWDVVQRLETGTSLDEVVAATVATRDEQVATRRLPITGLTEYPNLAETLPERDGEPDDVRRYGAGVRGAPRRAGRHAGVPGHPGLRRCAHGPGDVRDQPVRGGRDPGVHRLLRRPARRLPRRHRRGVRRVGSRHRGRPPSGGRRPGRRGGQDARVGRRLVCDGR